MNVTESVSQIAQEPPSGEGNLVPRKKEYDAVFRGRAMVGLEISLPAGYTGVVLRGDNGENCAGPSTSSSRIKEKMASRPSSRITRRSSRSVVAHVDIDNDEEMDALEIAANTQALKELNATGADDEHLNTRLLKPASCFDSMIIWEADNPVDEGKNEYVRSLRE